MANIGYIAGPSIMLDVLTLVDGLTFPASTDYQNFTPSVSLLGTKDDGTKSKQTVETIEIAGAVKDGDIEWRDTGRIVGETFTIPIVIRTAVPGKTAPQAAARAIALSEVIQAGLRDNTTGKPAGLSDTRIVDNYRLSGYQFDPFPVGDTGWGYDYTINLRIHTRH